MVHLLMVTGLPVCLCGAKIQFLFETNAKIHKKIPLSLNFSAFYPSKGQQLQKT